MASEVDICNMALSFLGDSANIVSINPPSGSSQAEHCARYYPLARDGMLERHSWNFATRVQDLPSIQSTNPSWAYAYALPSDFLGAVSAVSADSHQDFSAGYDSYSNLPFNFYQGHVSDPNPLQYVIEMGVGNMPVLASNLSSVRLKYISKIVDTVMFSPSFISAVSWGLASMLAGVMLKSDVGAKQAEKCASMAEHYVTVARRIDSNQRNVKPQQAQAPWIAFR